MLFRSSWPTFDVASTVGVADAKPAANKALAIATGSAIFLNVLVMVVTLYLDTGIGFLEPNDKGGRGRYLRGKRISIYRFFDGLFV